VKHPRAIRRLLRALLCDRGGNVAIIFAVALPLLAMVSAGGIELAFLFSDRTKMQGVADAAALSGAKELTLAMQTGALHRAQMFAEAELADLKSRSSVTVDAEIIRDGAAMKVMITSHRGSFFGNLLPPGGFTTRAEAIAERMGRVPLCVLSSEVGAGAISDNAKMTAGQCMVHSNTDIEVGNSAWLMASAVQSVGEARGRITPEAQVGGQAIEDPFTGINFSQDGLCLGIGDLLLNLGLSVLPGPHCGNIIIHEGQTLNLAPGIHYFQKGKLELKEDAKLIGKNVVLIFDEGSSLKLRDQAQITLEGRTSGQFAGFVIATTKANTQTFEISTDNARKLLGTVYIPSATLQISGAGTKVADQSPWTVIVARSVEMIGSPDLVINANYAGSSVPVPKGVGPNFANARLAQ